MNPALNDSLRALSAILASKDLDNTEVKKEAEVAIKELIKTIRKYNELENKQLAEVSAKMNGLITA